MMEFVAAPVITFESAEQSLFGTAQNPITLESSSEEEGDITPAVSVAKVIPHTHTHTHTQHKTTDHKKQHTTHTHTHTHITHTHTQPGYGGTGISTRCRHGGGDSSG